MNWLRSTSAVTRFRQAHRAGRPVLLAVEIACLVPTVAAVGWAASSPGYLPLVVAYATALTMATVLVIAATLALPDDAPPCPSWFQKQRARSRPALSRGE